MTFFIEAIAEIREFVNFTHKTPNLVAFVNIYYVCRDNRKHWTCIQFCIYCAVPQAHRYSCRSWFIVCSKQRNHSQNADCKVKIEQIVAQTCIKLPFTRNRRFAWQWWGLQPSTSPFQALTRNALIESNCKWMACLILSMSNWSGFWVVLAITVSALAPTRMVHREIQPIGPETVELLRLAFAAIPTIHRILFYIWNCIRSSGRAVT